MASVHSSDRRTTRMVLHATASTALVAAICLCLVEVGAGADDKAAPRSDGAGSPAPSGRTIGSATLDKALDKKHTSESATPARPASCPSRVSGLTTVEGRSQEFGAAKSSGSGVTGVGAGLHKRLSGPLVPPGPAYLTVCRYAGFNQKVSIGTLERTKVLSGPTLSSFVDLLDGTRWTSPLGAYSCPIDFGELDLLHFVYGSGPQFTLSVDPRGCELVSNGSSVVIGARIASVVAAWVGTDTN